MVLIGEAETAGMHCHGRGPWAVAVGLLLQNLATQHQVLVLLLHFNINNNTSIIRAKVLQTLPEN